MATIDFTYFIYKDDEQVFQSTAEVKLTKMELKATEEFITSHQYSPEFEDIPGKVYDKCCEKAFEKALAEFPDLAENYEVFFVELENYIPVGLIMQLSDDVKKKMLTDEPYYMEESEIFPSAGAEASEAVQEEALPSVEVRHTKENTLYLTIKQVYFDQIIAGTKRQEVREIKSTTYKKYLECSEEGDPYFYESLVDLNNPLCGDICFWNGGVYPYAPKEKYQFLHLAVGYNKERDEAIVEIEDVTFEPLKDKNGHPCRFSEKEDGVVKNADGDLCFWNIVYHLGKVVDLHRKTSNS